MTTYFTAQPLTGGVQDGSALRPAFVSIAFSGAICDVCSD